MLQTISVFLRVTNKKYINIIYLSTNNKSFIYLLLQRFFILNFLLCLNLFYSFFCIYYFSKNKI